MARWEAAGEKVYFLVRQMAITGTNALAGFLIVRYLPKPEYAVYTIAFALLSLFVNITNMGITPAMSGIGGSIWADRREMRALLNTALRLRGQLGRWFIAPFTGYALWQFRQAETGWAAIVLLIVLLLFAAWVQLQTALYTIVAQLNKAVRALQSNEMRVTLLKLAGIAGLLVLSHSAVVLTGWICACLWLNLQANKRLAAAFLEPHETGSEPHQKAINAIIRSNFLRTVYWSLEGQISILLCAVFANSNAVADIGALGRLSVYFSIFQAFILNYSLPGVAKAREKSEVWLQTRKIGLLTLVLLAPLLVWALVHPASLLWLLGPNYTALGGSLFYFLAAVAIGQTATVVYQVCAAKAWIQMNRFYVPLALPFQVLIILTLDMANFQHIILFLGLNNVFFLMFNLLMFFTALRRYPLQHEPADAGI